VILLAPGRAQDQRLLGALRPLLGSIAVDRMRRANLMVDRDADKRTPAEAADWLLNGR
jgi:osmoprotectant transport system permease protein